MTPWWYKRRIGSHSHDRRRRLATSDWPWRRWSNPTRDAYPRISSTLFFLAWWVTGRVVSFIQQLACFSFLRPRPFHIPVMLSRSFLACFLVVLIFEVGSLVQTEMAECLPGWEWVHYFCWPLTDLLPGQGGKTKQSDVEVLTPELATLQNQNSLDQDPCTVGLMLGASHRSQGKWLQPSLPCTCIPRACNFGELTTYLVLGD